MNQIDEYLSRWKLELYEKAGIVPWKNLIVTYDDEQGMQEDKSTQTKGDKHEN